MLTVASNPAPKLETWTPEDTLLRIMRDPTSIVESVHEQCRIDDWNIDVTTQVRFNKTQLPDTEWFYLNVENPDKGDLHTYDILTPEVSPATHDEHIRAAQRCIATRYASLIRSFRFKNDVSIHKKNEILQKLVRIAPQLNEIPKNNPVEAIRIFHKLFDKDRKQLRDLPEEYEAVFSSQNAEGLFRFCKLVARKYLSLVRIPSGNNLPNVVEFQSKKDFDIIRKQEGQEGSTQPETNGFKLGKLKDSIKYSTFAAFPPDIRLHLSWPKRTTHYTLSIHAPDGRFFSGNSSNVLTRDERGVMYCLRPREDDAYFKWSLAQKETVRTRSNLFIGDASLWKQPIYFKTTHYEIPGRSTLRMIGLTALAVAMMIVMTKEIDKEQLVHQISAILAILALGLAVSPFGKDEGFSNVPLLSRITPAAVFVSLCVYIAWAITKEAIFFWSDWGWAVPIFSVGVLLIIHLRRAIHIGRDFCKETKVVNGGGFSPVLSYSLDHAR